METLQRTANRGSISTGYEIDNSLKFEADNNEYVRDAHNTAGNRKELTISFWCKITEFGTQRMPLTAGARQARIWFDTNDQLWVQLQDAPGYRVKTNRVFRDPSAWYHIVVAIDTTQATDSNRIKLWVNGVQETSWATTQYPPQNFDGFFNVNQAHLIGDNTYDFSGYMADFFFIDDQVLQATDFGEYDEDSGIWIPKEYGGTFGGQSFYLKFDNASDLDERSDGLSNGVSMSLSNITSADQATDTPTNNFAIGNPLAYFSAASTTLSDGSTILAKGATGWETLSATIAVTSGKWYMEFQNINNQGYSMASVFPADIGFISAGGQNNNYAGKVSGDGGLSYYSATGNLYQNDSNASYGATWGGTQTMGIALDMDNGKVYFAKSNVWQNSGDPTSGATGTGAINLIKPSEPHMMGYGLYATSASGAVNFGGYTPSSIASAASDENGYGTFEYAPPSGYYALCTKNLAEFG